MKYIHKHLVLVLLLGIFSFSVSAQTIRMETVLGNIDIELHPDAAPNTVTNFLNYMNSGAYNNSFIHRNGVSEGQVFVVQGGGFKFGGNQIFQIPPNPPVINEFLLPNIRGTIAMAKLENQPNSATSQWFFNVVDNTVPLDTQNGGFTVFGTVIAGMDVVDAMAELDKSPSFVVGDNTVPVIFQINNQDFGFFDVPYLNDLPVILQEDDAVIISNVFELDAPLKVNSGLNGAWFNPDTSGQGILLEILPVSNRTFMAWFTYDTQLPADGVLVNVGDAGHRWITGLGVIDQENKTITFDLTVTSGGLFDNGQMVTNSAPESYGTMTISFEDCANATVVYNLIAQGLSGSFPLIRISSENIALCQRLSNEAN